MSFGRLAGPLAALVLGGLVLWRAGTGAGDAAVYAPDVYVARADAFIRAGLLSADCSGPETRLVPKLNEASTGDRSWYQDSYLAGDVARFNADPEGFGWAFVLDEDCRLRGVNPVVHAIELPFHERLSWLGRILWRSEGTDATLRSAERVITMRKPRGPVSAADSAAAEVGDGRAVLQEGVVLLHFPGGRGQPAARLFHVGDDVVLHNRVRAERPETVRLLGHGLPVGRLARLETGDWLHLASDDRYTRAAETFVFLGGEARESASLVRRQNDRFERKSEDAGLGRILDPVREDTDPYLDLVARSLDSALAALPERRARDLATAFDIQLTLRREVQLQVGDAFEAACDEVARTVGAETTFPAALTVMDGKTGDLLALATYPGEDDLDLRSSDGALDNRARRLLRNHNFALHPIGSVGKPFFFAAAAQAHPGLLGLVIDEHPPEGRHGDLFHCALDEGYQLLPGHYGPIDFSTALEMSCNKYTMELVTLSLAADRARDPALRAARGRGADAGLGQLVSADESVEWPRPGRSSGLRVGGRALTAAPDLSGYVFVDGPVERATTDDPSAAAGAAVRCSSLDRLDQASFRAPLEILTGAATYRGLSPQGLPGDATERELALGYRTNRYDLEPWRPLLDYLSEDTDEATSWRIRAALQGVAPERVNLAFNQVTRVRSDYVSLLLGGGTSVWTNIQLAEAMARLVTGRAVEARLVAEVVPSPSANVEVAETAATAESAPEAAPEVGLRPEVRAAVLDGMARVVTGARGTATALRAEIATLERAFPGDTIAVYAKTGSPITERTVPAATAQALEALVVRGRLALEGRRLVARSGRETIAWVPRSGVGRTAFLKVLASGLREVDAPRGGAVQRAITRVVDRAAEPLSDPSVVLGDLVGPLRADAGGLRLDRDDPLFARRRVQGMAGVLVVAVVRLPGRQALPPSPRALADPAARVLTLAMHLEADEDSQTAVAAAKAVLPVLVPLLR